jgi:uncharacterized protein YoaH (UPF0181 family)
VKECHKESLFHKELLYICYTTFTLTIDQVKAMKERIIEFLAQGMSPTQTASIVGVSASYISQLRKEPEFLQLVEDKKKEFFASENVEDKVLNNKYAAVEHAILNQLESQLAYAELPALTRALEVVGNRQEKRFQRMHPASIPQVGVNVNVLQLTLPSHAAQALPAYSLNEKKEVVAIGDRTMSPLSSEGVKNLFNQLSGKSVSALPLEDDGKTLQMENL